MDEFRLDGRVALITGAGRGIGAGIAEVLSEAGADVAINALTERYVKPLADGLTERTGRRVLARIADVTKKDEADELVATVLSEFGKLDILVNNLGDAIQAPLVALPDDPSGKALTDEELGMIVDINVMAALHCTRAVGAHLLERRSGKVVNVSGYAGLRGRPNQTVYSIGKAGLVGFTRSLAHEWAPFRIQVNAIAPGTFPDPITVAEVEYESAVAAAAERIPLGRVGRLREVGLLALYLASPASDYMTGQVIALDGGLTA